MKDIINYSQKSIYDQNNNLISEYSTNTTVLKGTDVNGNSYVINTMNDDISSSSLPSATDYFRRITTTDTDFSNNPVNYYINYDPIIKPEKEIKRRELINMTRMNLLKEFLDAFDKCEEMIHIQELVSNIRKEYKKLSEEAF